MNSFRQAAVDFTVPPIRMTVSEVECVNRHGEDDILLIIRVDPGERNRDREPRPVPWPSQPRPAVTEPIYRQTSTSVRLILLGEPAERGWPGGRRPAVPET
jgi:hypothetical protein